jgi:hypothetical protein
VAGVETSTHKAAMCAVHILHDIMRALISGIDNPLPGRFCTGDRLSRRQRPTRTP